MRAGELISCLDKVRRSGRGWVAQCPAHDDRTPSLSIREGYLGILIRCWAGCSLDEICTALGLKPCDLFYDTRPDPARIREAHHRRQVKDAAQKAALYRPDVFREAEAITKAVTITDVSALSGKELDEMMDIVSNAWLILMEERDHEWIRTIAA